MARHNSTGSSGTGGVATAAAAAGHAAAAAPAAPAPPSAAGQHHHQHYLHHPGGPTEAELGRAPLSLFARLNYFGRKWCRYCGTTTPVHWRSGPWGPNTLCKYAPRGSAPLCAVR